MMPFSASIHTFGFGNSLKSGLLKSIAEIGNGNYAFIPDAGMIGTVFVHAIANLQATCATDAVLKLYPSPGLQIEETMGDSVIQQAPEKTGPSDDAGMSWTIPLGNIQFGQPRDIFLRIKGLSAVAATEKNAGSSSPHVNAELSFKPAILAPSSKYQENESRADSKVLTHQSLLDQCSLPVSEIDYHESRAQICGFISSMFPIAPNGDHRIVDSKDLPSKQEILTDLIKKIESKAHSDSKNQSLMEDLKGVEPNGQLSLAILNSGFFYKWGIHYLPSYLNAHTRQICNSFKDPGPLQYGVDSPLFISCRDKLDSLFDSLPAPKPTLPSYQKGGGGQPIHMARWNNARGPCFAGFTLVELASGKSLKIKKLRQGMVVKTPVGPRQIVTVLKTPVQRETLCRVDGVVVTPWHPVSLDGKEWHFPAMLADHPVIYSGAVYSVMLQRDADSTAHALNVGGLWGVTLGHGITSGNDVRAHEFLGDYARVESSLQELGFGRNGLITGGGIRRSEKGGRVCGFEPLK